MAKSDKIEVARRVAEVYTLLVRGYSRIEICRYGRKKWDNLSYSQVDRYIRRAGKDFISNLEKNKEMLLGKTITRLENVYKKALEEDDFKTCIGIEKMYIDLFKFNEKEYDESQTVELQFEVIHEK